MQQAVAEPEELTGLAKEQSMPPKPARSESRDGPPPPCFGCLMPGQQIAVPARQHYPVAGWQHAMNLP